MRWTPLGNVRCTAVDAASTDAAGGRTAAPLRLLTRPSAARRAVCFALGLASQATAFLGSAVLAPSHALTLVQGE